MTDDSENEVQSNLLHVHVCIQCGHVLDLMGWTRLVEVS
jgi:hypothetical protein